MSSYLSAYRGQPVVVTGATGFIGRWVARALHAAGADVHVLVRDPVRAAEISTRIGMSPRIISCDLSEPHALARELTAVQPAVLFNLAGYGVDPAERDADTAHFVNTEIVRVICETMEQARSRSWAGQAVVHAGSALEYGEVGGDLHEATVARPTTLYGQSKLAGTRALTEYCRRSGLRGVTARLFTVYGPGELAGRLLPSLITAAANHKTLDLTAGTQQRDFTYVEDAAEGLLRVGATTGNPGEIINIATGVLSSVLTFVEVAAGVLHLPASQLRFGALPVRAEEMQHQPVNIARLHSLTSWQPSTSIAEGVRQTLKWNVNE